MDSGTSPPLTEGGFGDPFAIANAETPDQPRRRFGITTPGQSVTWSLVSQGAFLGVKAKLNYSRSPVPSGRGQCQSFTNASRLRLLKMIAKMDWDRVGPSLFITLTYPDELANRRMTKRTQDRSQFMRDVEKYFRRRVPSIWRTEWERRKTGRRAGQEASHIHLMLLGVGYIPWQDIRKWWKRILGIDTYVHTYVERCHDGEGACKYVAKYCAKKETPSSLVNAAYLNKVGRHWGTTRKSQIPLHDPKSILDLTTGQIDVLRSVAAGLLKTYDYRYDTSFTLLGEKAKKFAKLFWENGVDTDIVEWYLDQVEGGEGPDLA